MRQRSLSSDSLLLKLCIRRKLGVGVGIGVVKGILWIVAIALFNERKNNALDEYRIGDSLLADSV